MNRRILITGAAGFLGSHLCDRFFQEGFEVIGMDNLITGDRRNIEHLFREERFTFYHHDVTTFVHVPGHLDYILHFAFTELTMNQSNHSVKMPISKKKCKVVDTLEHPCYSFLEQLF